MPIATHCHNCCQLPSPLSITIYQSHNKLRPLLSNIAFKCENLTDHLILAINQLHVANHQQSPHLSITTVIVLNQFFVKVNSLHQPKHSHPPSLSNPMPRSRG
ncbi:hypothetical protein U1Q18_005856 [Sarracenia purpurea var. burkii]